MILRAESFAVKAAFLIGYPALSFLPMRLGIYPVWHPSVVIAASGMLVPMAILMRKLIALEVDPHPVYILVLYAFAFSLKTSEYASIGLVLDSVTIAAVLYLFSKYKLLYRLQVPPRHSAIILFYWLIYTLSASVPTSSSLAKLNYAVNLVPFFLFGIIFGWFGPEVTCRFVGSRYGIIRANALELAFSLTIAVLYGYVLGDVYSTMRHVGSDGGEVLVAVMIAMPSMLISRITVEALRAAQAS